MKLKVGLLLGCVICLTTIFPVQADYGRPGRYYDEIFAGGVHDGGFLSFNYGPAILTSWKSAVFMEFPLPNGGLAEPTVFPKREAGPPKTFNRYVILENDQNAALVKRWLEDHLHDRINLTPNTPASGAFTFRFNYLLLFSSTVPPVCDWDDDGQPILSRRQGDFKNAELNKSLILGIPCTKLIFGWTAENERRDLDSLKKLMKLTGQVPKAE